MFPLFLSVLKDEPEDLTHLAPTAGDVCVPLEGPFLGDVFDDFMLSDNYCPLLSDDSSNSKFFLYRDPGDMSPPGHSRHLLSPTLSPTLSSALSEVSVWVLLWFSFLLQFWILLMDVLFFTESWRMQPTITMQS